MILCYDLNLTTCEIYFRLTKLIGFNARIFILINVFINIHQDEYEPADDGHLIRIEDPWIR